MSENEGRPGLVEPEGVNAGSAAATDESPSTGSTPPHGDVLRGDGPERVPDQAPVDPADGDVGTAPQDPGQHAAESGQDGGSMG